MKDEPNRRDLLKGIGALGSATLAGCSLTSGNGAQELADQNRRTENKIRRDLPWNEYRLDYDNESLNLDKKRLEPTGVESASQYRIDIKFALSNNSDDLDGWMATSERRAEFFSLLNKTTYDVLRRTTEDFSDFEPPKQPSNRNQVVEYKIRVDAEDCSYVSDTVPATRMDEILSSRSAYADYVDDGSEYEINIEDAFLGLDLFC